MSRSSLEGDIADVEGAFEALGAIEQALNGEQLDAGIFAAIGGGVETGLGSLFVHGFRWFGERDIDTNLGVFAVEDAAQIA